MIDLVIPRGSNKLVSQIKSETKIPVLGHSGTRKSKILSIIIFDILNFCKIKLKKCSDNCPDGICHVYVDKLANMEKAKRIVYDAKLDYPAACNAMVISLTHWPFSSLKVYIYHCYYIRLTELYFDFC